jgi:hypothetical protein
MSAGGKSQAFTKQLCECLQNLNQQRSHLSMKEATYQNLYRGRIVVENGKLKTERTPDVFRLLPNDAIRHFLYKKHQKWCQEVFWPENVHKVRKKAVRP